MTAFRGIGTSCFSIHSAERREAQGSRHLFPDVGWLQAAPPQVSARVPQTPGWHVDEEGRSVLRLPGVRQSAFLGATDRVVIEYAEGARRVRREGEDGGATSTAV